MACKLPIWDEACPLSKARIWCIYGTLNMIGSMPVVAWKVPREPCCATTQPHRKTPQRELSLYPIHLSPQSFIATYSRRISIHRVSDFDQFSHNADGQFPRRKASRATQGQAQMPHRLPQLSRHIKLALPERCGVPHGVAQKCRDREIRYH